MGHQVSKIPRKWEGEVHWSSYRIDQAFVYSLLVWSGGSLPSRRFFREGVSRDAEHYGKAQNVFTSWFASQTGSAHIFPPLINWSASFSQGGVYQGVKHYGEAGNVVTSCFARQTGSAIIFPLVIDWFAPFSQEGAFSGGPTKLESLKWENGANQWITGRKMLVLLVWGTKQEVKPFLTSPLPSAPRETSFLRKRHEAINYRQENAGTSCLASETGSSNIFGFTMLFGIPISPVPEKAVWIKQLQVGKWGHFLFGEQNRKWKHLWLHHSVPYPEIPPP